MFFAARPFLRSLLSQRPRTNAPLRHRRPAQNLVEYGLTVAAVAIIAMVGFKALGAAQATYWGAISSSPILAAPTPAQGDFLHPTNVVLAPTPNCDPTATWLAGQPITCTVTVTDTFGSNFHTPTGSINLTVDGTTVSSCTLTMINGQSSSCTLTYTWTPTDANKPGKRVLVAAYTATSNHSDNNSNALSFTVTPQYLFQFTCQSALGGGTTVEVGEPLFCTLMVAENFAPTNPPAPGGVTVTVSASTSVPHGYAVLCVFPQRHK